MERQPDIDATCPPSLPDREGPATPRNGSHPAHANANRTTHGTYYEADMRVTIEIHDDDLIELTEITWATAGVVTFEAPPVIPEQAKPEQADAPIFEIEKAEHAGAELETGFEAEGEPTEETELTIDEAGLPEIEALAEIDELLEVELEVEEAEGELDGEPVTYQSFSATAWRIEQREDAASLRQSEFDRLFNEWRATQDPRLRERLILMNRNLVSYLARKFLDRGELSEDIIQQGLIGLINALDHFDPARGVRFATFATPTIMGEIRRYFRDKTWGIRVPRRLQELNQVINAKIEDLTQELDRSPSYPEIARALGLQVEEVVEALEMVHALEPMSIEEEVYFGSDDSATVVGDQLGANDPHLEGWNEHAALGAALEKLPENERTVLQLAYFEELSQTEIARRMQVSQMYISRLQRKALSHLRELLNSTDV